MELKRHSAILGLIAATWLLAGCPGPNVQPDTQETGDATADQAPSAQTGPMDDDITTEIIPDESPDGDLLSKLVIYFDFDQSDIRSDFNPMLAAHGRYLAGNPRQSIRLEGHADERGSREYNIGLGERRAQAVRRVLLLQGASADQISTVSFGEERPAILGSNEEAWELNRRVELSYQQ